MNQQSNNPPSFLDAKTLISILLMALLWIVWQNHMEKKYGSLSNTNQSVLKDKKEETGVSAISLQKLQENPKNQDAISGLSKPNISIKEEVFKYEDDNWSFIISSKGMGLKKVLLKKYKDRHGKIFKYGNGVSDNISLFSSQLVGEDTTIDFKIKKINEHTYEGISLNSGVVIKKHIVINSSLYVIETNVEISSISKEFKGLSTNLFDVLPMSKTSSFLMPAVDNQEVYIKHENSSDRISLKLEEALEKSIEKSHLMTIGTNYFTSALIDQSSVLPETNIKSSGFVGSAAYSSFIYKPISQDKLILKYKSFVGPKDLNLLKKVDAELDTSIDFGWFGWIGIIFLRLMKWLYSLIPNYGISIILLTVLVRLVVLPFNIMSYRSMKKMQVIQPKLSSVREIYKNDPQALNRETMLLMRENKVNPFGGCLPMLIQLPIFISLYRVFGQSIELYQQPFMLWINDLSLKDPYYIFPSLMGITMFIQQKITPTTLDPAQTKVMLFMPIIFSFLMISLPSSLTLYIFVSTLFGVVQQALFMKLEKL